MIKVEFKNIINKIFYNSQKLVAVFVLSLILLNTFVPKNVELKNSFMSAVNCAIKTVQTNFYDQYSNVVMSVINSILSNLNVEELTGIQAIQAQQKQENNKQVPVNTSSDNAIVITNNINNQNTLNVLKVNLSYLVYETSNKLYNIYESIKINSSKETSTMGILFFILFSILVVRIKDIVAVILNNKLIVRKPTWLLV